MLKMKQGKKKVIEVNVYRKEYFSKSAFDIFPKGFLYLSINDRVETSSKFWGEGNGNFMYIKLIIIMWEREEEQREKAIAAVVDRRWEYKMQSFLSCRL